MTLGIILQKRLEGGVQSGYAVDDWRPPWPVASYRLRLGVG